MIFQDRGYNNWCMSKKSSIVQIVCVIALFGWTFLYQSVSLAAGLDDLYGPLLEKNEFLYSAEVSYFDMTENGRHGSASFDFFESDPDLLSVKHSLQFSPIADFEVVAGYGQFLPRDYTRFTYDGPTQDLDTVQDHSLHHLQDYILQLRLRKNLFEAYLTFQEKRQKAETDVVLLLNDTTSFDDIKAHYEDAKMGMRYLSEAKEKGVVTGYFNLTQPLLGRKQINVEVGLGFRNGKAQNISDIYVLNVLYIRHYLQQLRPHFIPEVLLRYGMSDRLEWTSGFSYTTPFKYNYEFRQFNPASSNFITGTYNVKSDLKAPFKMTYRPSDCVSVTVSSDFHYVKQRLDSWEKETDDSITLYNSRKLRYYNTKPTFKLSYFHDADKEMVKEKFASLTKQMLLRRQFLMSIEYQQDVTILKKSDGNGPQNIIDPYSLFLYPLDVFVSGSEYGAFFLGNKTTRAAAVRPQNFHHLEAIFNYGVNDFLNFGLEAGYRSGSVVHHFTAHDLADRYYQFEPFYYFNLLTDWQIKKNCLLSLKTHFVPQYKTFLDTSVHPKQFETETRYYEVSLTLKILF